MTPELMSMAVMGAVLLLWSHALAAPSAEPEPLQDNAVMDGQCCERMHRRLAAAESKLESTLAALAEQRQLIETMQAALARPPLHIAGCGDQPQPQPQPQPQRQQCPPAGPLDPTCVRIQRATWGGGWAALAAADKAKWAELDCPCKLRSEAGRNVVTPSGCAERPAGWEELCTVFERGDYNELLYPEGRGAGGRRPAGPLVELTTPLTLAGGARTNLTVQVPVEASGLALAAALREKAFGQRLQLGPAGLERVLQAATQRLDELRAAVAADLKADPAAAVDRVPALVQSAAHVLLIGPTTCDQACWACLLGRVRGLCARTPAGAAEKRLSVLAGRPNTVTGLWKLPAVTGCQISLMNGSAAAATGSVDSSEAVEKVDRGGPVRDFEAWAVCQITKPAGGCPPLHLRWADLVLLDHRALPELAEVVWVVATAGRSSRLCEIATAKSVVRPGGLIFIEAHPFATPEENVFTRLIYNAHSKTPGRGPMLNLSSAATAAVQGTPTVGPTDSGSDWSRCCLYRRPAVVVRQLLRMSDVDMLEASCNGSSSDGGSNGCSLLTICTTQGQPAGPQRTVVQTAAVRGLLSLRPPPVCSHGEGKGLAACRPMPAVVAAASLLTESLEWAAQVERLSGGSALAVVRTTDQGPPALQVSNINPLLPHTPQCALRFFFRLRLLVKVPLLAV